MTQTARCEAGRFRLLASGRQAVKIMNRGDACPSCDRALSCCDMWRSRIEAVQGPLASCETFRFHPALRETVSRRGYR
ncbi:hypothetical protein DDE01_16370 [Desulfovibrio desulfuricans]|nr:hypothetical protein DDE01_16370 [Desulfovibrio desulfuricans]